MVSAKLLFLLFYTYFLISFCDGYYDDLFFNTVSYYLKDSNVCSPNEINTIRFARFSNKSIEVTHKGFQHQVKLDRNSSCKFKVQSYASDGIYVEIKKSNLLKNPSSGECIEYIQFRSKNHTSEKFCGHIPNFVKTDFIDTFGEIEVTVHILENGLKRAPFEEDGFNIKFSKYYICDLGDGDYWMADKLGCIIFNRNYTRSKYKFIDDCPLARPLYCILKPNLTRKLDSQGKTISYLQRLNYSGLGLFNWEDKFKPITFRPIRYEYKPVSTYNSTESGSGGKIMVWLSIILIKIVLIILRCVCCKKSETNNRSIVVEDINTNHNEHLIPQRPNVNNQIPDVTHEDEIPIIILLTRETEEQNSQSLLDASENLDNSPPSYKDLPQPPEYQTLFPTK